MYLDFEEIKKILPHRFPIILIDRVLEFKKKKSIKAIKNVSGNEIQFLGHFPDKAVMPGVFTVEAMAQAAAILALLSFEESERKQLGKIYFASINKMRFLKPVLPGDQLIINVEIIKLIKYAGIVNVTASVDKDIAARGELSFGAQVD